MLNLEWLWSWQRPDLEFTTPLSVDECRARLVTALAYKKRLFGVEADHPVIGLVKGQSFCMTKAPSPFYRDAFTPFLYGRLIATGDGATIQATYRLETVMALILAGFGLLSGLSALQAMLAHNLVYVLAIVVMWGIVGTFVRIGSWSNKANREVLGIYLRATLLSGASK